MRDQISTHVELVLSVALHNVSPCDCLLGPSSSHASHPTITGDPWNPRRVFLMHVRGIEIIA